jgi:hypothetical protein
LNPGQCAAAALAKAAPTAGLRDEPSAIIASSRSGTSYTAEFLSAAALAR